MGSLAALLGSFATGFAPRVLASLGMGFVSFAGYSFLLSQLVEVAVNNWGGITGDTLGYLSLSGFPQGLGIILGCVVLRGSLMGLATLGKIS